MQVQLLLGVQYLLVLAQRPKAFGHKESVCIFMVISPQCSRKKNWKVKRDGFTLIELLVVVSIIGLLSSIVLVSLHGARVKARDAVRIQTVKQLDTAIRLYVEDNGQAPPILHMLTGFDDPPTLNCGHNNRWCALEDMLSAYIGELPKDEPMDDTYYYMYYASPGDGYQKYGVGVMLEDQSSFVALNDGGFYPGPTSSSVAFELGPAVGYCMSKYSGEEADWFWKSGNWSDVCEGGN